MGTHPYHFTTMELILVRHGLPVRRENVDGPADPELSADGHAQARAFADYMHIEHLDAIYTSPMRRAYQTAEPLASLKGMTPVVVDGVAEFDQMANEYIPVEELKRQNDPRWQEMAKGGWQGEGDQEEFRERVINSLEEIINNHRGGRVVVTCHGGVINEYISHILNIDNGQFFYPNYTSIHRIAAASSGERSVLSLNEIAHLRGTGLPIGLFHG